MIRVLIGAKVTIPDKLNGASYRGIKCCYQLIIDKE